MKREVKNLCNKYNHLISSKETLIIYKMGHIPKHSRKTLRTKTSTLNNFKSLTKQIYQKGCTHSFNKKKDQNNYFRAEMSQRYEKLHTVEEKTLIHF